MIENNTCNRIGYIDDIKSYLININILKNDSIFKSSLKLLPDTGLWRERRNIIHKYKFLEDKCRSLGAGLLLLYILSINKVEDISLFRNKYGKIYNNSLEFNISHSGEFVICSVGYSINGIDIEKIDAGDLSVAERFFNPVEYEILLKCKEDIFTNIWTLKESYIKALGKGLSIPLESFSVIDKNIINMEKFINNIKQLNTDEYINKQLNMQFQEFYISEYKIAVCSSNRIVPELNIINCLDIINYLEKNRNIYKI